MKYSERIRDERRERKLSQASVAKVLGVKQRTYCDYESERVRLPLESLIALAEFYGYSVDYMCGLTNEKRPYPDEA